MSNKPDLITLLKKSTFNLEVTISTNFIFKQPFMGLGQFVS